MIVVRSIVFNIVFYITFAALMLVGLPCLAMPRPATIAYVRMWARVSVWLLKAICGTRVEFRNLHLLPKGASILAVKHQSFLETFALITVLDDFTYILKKELTAIPFFGWYLMGTGQIAIDRGKKAGTLPRLQRSVRDKLAAGRQVVIFPEGTRRPVGVAPAYKVGVSVLVTDTGVTCTPVALNSGLFWPRRSFVRRPGTVVIEFLPPIPSGLGKRDFMRQLEMAIEPATNALVADAYARDPGLGAIVAEETARRLAEGEGRDSTGSVGRKAAKGAAPQPPPKATVADQPGGDRLAQERGKRERASSRLAKDASREEQAQTARTTARA